MLQGGVMGMETKERMCRADSSQSRLLPHNTGRVARIFSLAMAEGERMGWGSEGGWQGLACSHPRCFREALPPLCCLLQREQLCPCLHRQPALGSPSVPQLCASTNPRNNPGGSFSLQAEMLPPSLGSVAKPGGPLLASGWGESLDRLPVLWLWCFRGLTSALAHSLQLHVPAC